MPQRSLKGALKAFDKQEISLSDFCMGKKWNAFCQDASEVPQMFLRGAVKVP